MPNAEFTRLSRLIAIQTLLQTGQRLTARWLAERFQTSMRTVYRDIRTLEQAGLPVYAEPGRGYALVDGYTLPPVAFSEQEANALITAERLVARNKDASLVSDYREAITKVKAVLRHSTKERADLLAERVVVRDNPEGFSSDYLSVLQRAITHRTPLAITYEALADGSQTKRTIEPLALYSTHGNWVLIAWCRSRDDYRSFRVDQLRTICEEAPPYADRHFNLADYFEQCRKNFLPPDTGLSPPAPTFGAHQTPVTMETIKIQPFTVAGISVRTTNEGGQAGKDIEALFNRLMSENLVAQIPNKVDDAVCSVYTDYEGDHTQPYTVLLGCRVSNADGLPEGITAQHFEGGSYQPFVARGDLSQGAVYQQWVEIWNTDLDRAYTADFEVYGEKARDPADAEVDIFIAVKSS